MFRMVEHQADIAVELAAPNREAFFRTSLEALVSILAEGVMPLPLKDESECREILRVEGFDDEELLIKLLNEFLFLCQTGKFFPLSVEALVSVGDSCLAATIYGFRFRGRPPFIREVKAATYHCLKIQREPEWFAKVVLDV